jgi:RNA polymerase sigma-70 factor (ECF subfamily)
MTADSAEDLIQRIVAGERDAFAELYRRYRPDIFRFAAHFCGSAGQAEDIVQDVFLAVLQHASRYRAERSTVLPWLLGIARNHARRRRAERPMLPLPIDDTRAGQELAVESDPVMDLSRDRQTILLRRALGELPARYREAIILCDFHELTYLEAATALGCAVGTVRSRLHRARAMLARRLSDVEQPFASRLPAPGAVL